ncbi:MAG TPA: hypothetical protein PKC45_19320 [Gemmatales bacterium]|nr:hypothetical protein [Gemmatales bacterium]
MGGLYPHTTRIVREIQKFSDGTLRPLLDKEFMEYERAILDDIRSATSECTYSYEGPVLGKAPTDFTLSAFGLPEPYGVEWDRPTPWWLYALISAGVLFIVTVIVSFWKRRLAARSAA